MYHPRTKRRRLCDCTAVLCREVRKQTHTHTTGTESRSERKFSRPLTLKAQVGRNDPFLSFTTASELPWQQRCQHGSERQVVLPWSCGWRTPFSNQTGTFENRLSRKPAASESQFSPATQHQPMSRFLSGARLPAPWRHRYRVLPSLPCDVLDGCFCSRGPQSSRDAGDVYAFCNVCVETWRTPFV